MPRFVIDTRPTAGVSVYDATTEEKVLDVGKGEGPVQAAAFSPRFALTACAVWTAARSLTVSTCRARCRSSYLQVFHKPSGSEGEKNLKARLAAFWFVCAPLRC